MGKIERQRGKRAKKIKIKRADIYRGRVRQITIEKDRHAVNSEKGKREMNSQKSC